MRRSSARSSPWATTSASEVTAEGVETRRAYDKLATLGCDTLQGFYIQRPVSAEDISLTLGGLPERAASVSATLSRLLVDGDVGAAEAGERLSLPSGPTLLQPQPGKPRHQVELGRPRVAQLHGKRLDAAVGEQVVLGAEPLRDHVVDVDGNPSGSARNGMMVWPSGRRWRSGTCVSMRNRPPAEMRGGVLEARDLGILRHQVEDRVEDEIDEPNSPSTRVVAKSPTAMSMSSLPGFARNSATMASELSIPATRTPRPASGSAIRPVPIPNSTAPPPGELGQQVDDRRHDRRVEHVRGALVIDRRDALSEEPFALRPVCRHARVVYRNFGAVVAVALVPDYAARSESRA